MKTDYTPDRYLTVEDYAKAMNARNTPLNLVFEQLAELTPRLMKETDDMDSFRNHPILAMYAKQIASQIGAYINIVKDESDWFCGRRLHLLEQQRCLYAIRKGRGYVICRASAPGEEIASIDMPCDNIFAEVDKIRQKFHGDISNFNEETGDFAV